MKIVLSESQYQRLIETKEEGKIIKFPSLEFFDNNQLRAWHILQRILKTKETSFFMMELPVYRWPQAKNIGLMVFSKVKVFIKEAGKIIVAISIILWFLSTHGASDEFKNLEKKQIVLENLPSSETNSVELQKIETQKLEQSYIGNFGRLIEPAIKPIGYDWKIGIALITSFAAREVFVGTMATIYQSNETENEIGIKQVCLKFLNSS